MGDHRNVEGVLDQGREGYGPRALSHCTSLQEPIFALKIDHFLLVVGHIDVGRLELGKLPYAAEQGLGITAFQGRNQFKGEQRFFCLVEDVDYLHGLSIPYH